MNWRPIPSFVAETSLGYIECLTALAGSRSLRGMVEPNLPADCGSSPTLTLGPEGRTLGHQEIKELSQCPPRGLFVAVLLVSAVLWARCGADEAPDLDIYAYVLDPRVSVVGCREVEFFGSNSVSTDDCAILENRVIWFEVDQPPRAYGDLRFRRIHENRILLPKWWVPERFLIPVAVPVEHPGYEGAAK